ncbi:CUE domain-containing protein Cue1/4 family protein [Schizosaccharomyces japonicus yFS275]|uniref:CUE domain-containing protein Cue1/4 family protein n=1 Tax=Schizosaccharomyces japonicus (strain yFS275 / FY16936) TaxID=402676 RepID=B6JXC4_SCHJY|nr:CUE domain-containing protein Cue1/4 family protein [Schizosaccharomyces japonicus yFS275]EEB06025.1 CUE domain-containing protein Cue1/4 family protein [Schizosaccharomyces japonicus yFS275]
MQTEQVAGAIVLLTVAAFTLKWVFSSNSKSPATFRSPAVSHEFRDNVFRIHTMFPVVSAAAIAYDLQHTNSADQTIDNILSRQTLPEPPAEWPLNQLFAEAPVNQEATEEHRHDSLSSTGNSKPSLIEKYNLTARLSESFVDTDNKPVKFPSTKQERERLFRKRKEDAILRARKRMEEQANKE